MTASLFSLPPELIEHLVSFFTGAEVAAFSCTNRALHELIAEDNTHLWRALYLARTYDDPIEHGIIEVVDEFPWAATYKLRYTAEQRRQVRPVADAVIDTIRKAPSYSDKESADLAWAKELILRNPSLFRDFGEDAVARALLDADEETEDRRLHVRSLFPLSLLLPFYGQEEFRGRRQAARTYVYDMRNYTKARQWGPFKEWEDGVDWGHVDKIVTIVAANLKDFGATWPQPLQPPLLVHGPEALRENSSDMFRSDEEGKEAEKNPLDWAGVEGDWMRVVCFCDYRDLFHFNLPGGAGRDPGFFRDDFEEATRLLRMHMHVTDVDESIPSADPKRPTLRFVGSMRGFSALEHSDRSVRGHVRVMEDGEIRWSFVSLQHGEEQWSSEAIQLGGAASAAGLVGIWTGAHHAHGDPAGPFWAFKVNEEYVKPFMAWTL